MYFLLLHLLSAAWADPVDDLAPGPRELATVQSELDDRLAAAEAIERAVARLQSTFLVTPATDELCRDPIRGPLITRLRHFAAAWHDAAQRVRVQARRVERTAVAPTVTPVIDPDRREVLDRMLARARAQEAAWLEFVAWMDTQSIEVCALSLYPMAGLPDPIVRGEGEKPGPVAVTVSGTGFACPGGTAVEDGAVLIVTAPVCVAADATCACEPEPELPAAVLGR